MMYYGGHMHVQSRAFAYVTHAHCLGTHFSGCVMYCIQDACMPSQY